MHASALSFKIPCMHAHRPKSPTHPPTRQGKVTIFGRDPTKVAEAHRHVQELVADIREGEVYRATVIEVKDFGAVLEVLRGKEGLLHVSEISHKLDRPPVELLAVGQQVRVKCIGVDRIRGLIKLSRKALLDPHERDRLSPDQLAARRLLKVPVPPGTSFTHIDMKRLREARRSVVEEEAQRQQGQGQQGQQGEGGGGKRGGRRGRREEAAAVVETAVEVVEEGEGEMDAAVAATGAEGGGGGGVEVEVAGGGAEASSSSSSSFGHEGGEATEQEEEGQGEEEDGATPKRGSRGSRSSSSPRAQEGVQWDATKGRALQLRVEALEEQVLAGLKRRLLVKEEGGGEDVETAVTAMVAEVGTEAGGFIKSILRRLRSRIEGGGPEGGWGRSGGGRSTRSASASDSASEGTRGRGGGARGGGSGSGVRGGGAAGRGRGRGRGRGGSSTSTSTSTSTSRSRSASPKPGRGAEKSSASSSSSTSSTSSTSSGRGRKAATATVVVVRGGAD